MSKKRKTAIKLNRPYKLKQLYFLKQKQKNVNQLWILKKRKYFSITIITLSDQKYFNYKLSAARLQPSTGEISDTKCMNKLIKACM